MVSRSNDEAEILALVHANKSHSGRAYEKCFVHAGHTTRWHASPNRRHSSSAKVG